MILRKQQQCDLVKKENKHPHVSQEGHRIFIQFYFPQEQSLKTNYVRRKHEACSKEDDILSFKGNLQAIKTFDSNLLYDNLLT